MEEPFDELSLASEVKEHLPASRPILHPVLWSLALVLAVLGGAVLYLLDAVKVSPLPFALYASGVFALSFFSLGLIYAVLKRKADAEISDRFWRHTRDRVPIGRLVTGPSGGIVFVNQNFSEMFAVVPLDPVRSIERNLSGANFPVNVGNLENSILFMLVTA